MNPALAALIITVSSDLLVVLTLLIILQVILTRSLRIAHDRLQHIERRLSEYRSFNKYLRRKDRLAYSEILRSVSGSLNFPRAYRMFLGKQHRDLVETCLEKTKGAGAFLERFVPEYTKKQVELHKDFFKGKSLDGNQVEAIVKEDTYNLVIAAAGSGKTRTLTARLALLIKRGVPSDRILALAYTKLAAKEMSSRLHRDYGIADVDVRTFHSFGLKLAERSPDFRRGVAIDTDQRKFVKDAIEKLSHQRTFALLLLKFAIHSRTREPNDFPNPQKYYEYLQNQKYLTLNWTQVKSIAERDIANFLFMNRVKFDYERQATWADRNPEYRNYRPDFYLSEYHIWLEHWAIDRKGKVPPWFSSHSSGDPSVAYREGMQWKKEQYKKHGQVLIETYQYQWEEETLIAELKRQLEENKVELRELTTEEILERIRKLMPNRDPFNELIFSFISRAKTNGLGVNDIASRLTNGSWTRKQKSFASLMVPIWQEYESLLQQNDMIDFSDMINYALQVARKEDGELANRYSHILIDEFQDITDPQLELIKCFLSSNSDGTLFCVGDARQNIFSFAGSNIYNILHFDKIFPDPETTNLPTNYRCPKNVVAASNLVANLNLSELGTDVVPSSSIERPIRLLEMPADAHQEYEDWEHHRAKELLQELLGSKKPEEHIMVLARFNKPLERLKLEFPSHETLGLEFLTIHRAKGKEAEQVLLLGCMSGAHGFPSEIMDQSVLDIVKNSQVDNADKLEEERRLFYVALTRCRNQLFLFTSRNARSQFVSEIEPYLSK